MIWTEEEMETHKNLTFQMACASSIMTKTLSEVQKWEDESIQGPEKENYF